MDSNITFDYLPLELQAMILSHFTSVEAFHILQYVSKSWREICKMTNFRQLLFITSHYKIHCFDLHCKEEYQIDWLTDEEDKANSWLTGICLTPDFDLLVCDYRVNGIHRFKYNTKTWKFEYDSIFFTNREDDDWSPEYILCKDRTIYIAGDSETTISTIDDKKNFKNIYSNSKGIWGMTTKMEDGELNLFCCLPKKVIQVKNLFQNSNVVAEDFIQPKIPGKRIGCIAFIPPYHKKAGCVIVLDSFAGRAMLYSSDGEYILKYEDKRLKRAFDICFVDRNLHPFKGTSTNEKKENESKVGDISLLIFCASGILECDEDFRVIRTINTHESNLVDCNFVLITPNELI